jgi:hypothetical protein
VVVEVVVVEVVVVEAVEAEAVEAVEAEAEAEAVVEAVAVVGLLSTPVGRNEDDLLTTQRPHLLEEILHHMYPRIRCRESTMGYHVPQRKKLHCHSLLILERNDRRLHICRKADHLAGYELVRSTKAESGLVHQEI